MVRGDDFWIEEQPFLVGFGTDVASDIGELAEDGFPEMLGWMPRDRVVVAAMCNGSRDHRILGELCLGFARQTGGIVDFGGALSTMPQPAGPRPSVGTVRHEPPAGLKGRLLARTFVVGQGRTMTTHFGDASFLESCWVVLSFT